MDNQKISLSTNGTFTFVGEFIYFIETDVGNYIYEDPSYYGDNTIYKYNGTLDNFMKENKLTFKRNKGFHNIEEFCGRDVVIVIPSYGTCR